MTPTLAEIARALRGQVQGGQALCPGPGHSAVDRSLSIRLSAASPGGFVVFSHAGDDFRTCRDYVANALGLSADRWRGTIALDPVEMQRRAEARQRAEAAQHAETRRLQSRARAMWSRARSPKGTATEAYLNLRGLDLPEEIAGAVIRHHPDCPWGTGTVPAMVAAIRCVVSGEIVGVHRTALSADGRKLGRKVFGTATRAAIMLDTRKASDDSLVVGEGVETALTARQIGLAPVWSLISTSNIGVLPVLPGVTSLSILAEIDTTPNRPSETAFKSVAERWHAEGRTVDRLWPPEGCADLNDSVRRDLA